MLELKQKEVLVSAWSVKWFFWISHHLLHSLTVSAHQSITWALFRQQTVCVGQLLVRGECWAQQMRVNANATGASGRCRRPDYCLVWSARLLCQYSDFVYLHIYSFPLYEPPTSNSGPLLRWWCGTGCGGGFHMDSVIKDVWMKCQATLCGSMCPVSQCKIVGWVTGHLTHYMV